MAWLRSRRFLFQQFFLGDKAHKVIGNADALMPLTPYALREFVKAIYIEAPDKSSGKGCSPLFGTV